MGLLLIEREKWKPKYEDARAAVSEARAEVDREVTAHRVAMAEMKEREKLLQQALEVEQACVKNVSGSVIGSDFVLMIRAVWQTLLILGLLLV